MVEEYVVLVDEKDNVIGTMEKIEAHRKGVLHRAFSVFVFNSEGELILQQRAVGKYHSPGLWTNTCCSHPRLNEELEGAAHRRMQEEMGFDCPLTYGFNFIYMKQVGDLIEHELDHVWLGFSDSEPVPDPDEVQGWQYMTPQKIRNKIDDQPEIFTEWFKICFEEVNKHFEAMRMSIPPNS